MGIACDADCDLRRYLGTSEIRASGDVDTRHRLAFVGSENLLVGGKV